MNRESVVFFGTGEVSLAALGHIAQFHPIEAIITKPDLQTGNGKTVPSAVKRWGASNGVEIFQPAGAVELNSLFAQRLFRSRIGLVVDYGLIIPRPVIDTFPLGIINSHFSLLPEWRGADPITAALLSGQPTTGVSIMLIVPALDEGTLIAQADYDIPPNITISELTNALTNLSNKLLQQTLPQYMAGAITPWPQSTDITPTYSRKLAKQDGVIDWTKPARTIEREIRAYLGWPGSRTQLAGSDVIVTAAHVQTGQRRVASGEWRPGDPFKTESGDLAVVCDQEDLVIDQLKPAGKREMTGRAWLAGHQL